MRGAAWEDFAWDGEIDNLWDSTSGNNTNWEPVRWTTESKHSKNSVNEAICCAGPPKVNATRTA